MGTNYYAIRKASDDLKAKIILAIKQDDFETAKNLIPEKVHIGKSSAGWQFCFNHNDWKYFKRSLQDLEEFLSSSKITNEYGEDVSSDEFWKMVELKKDGKKHLFWNGRECGTMEFGLNFSNSTSFS